MNNLHVKLYLNEEILLFMTPEEREMAINDFLKSLQMLARKRYRDLKNMKMTYFYPIAASVNNNINSLARRSRKSSVTNYD